jgi:hypothetical protein
MLALGLLIAAVVLFIIAAVGVPTSRFNLVAAGLACMAAADVVGR